MSAVFVHQVDSFWLYADSYTVNEHGIYEIEATDKKTAGPADTFIIRLDPNAYSIVARMPRLVVIGSTLTGRTYLIHGAADVIENFADSFIPF